MSDLLNNLKSRREAIGAEIAALTGTSSPDRKKALYNELAEIEGRIARLKAPIEVETPRSPSRHGQKHRRLKKQFIDNWAN